MYTTYTDPQERKEERCLAQFYFPPLLAPGRKSLMFTQRNQSKCAKNVANPNHANVSEHQEFLHFPQTNKSVTIFS